MKLSRTGFAFNKLPLVLVLAGIGLIAAKKMGWW